jgi:hypothetical protein
MVEVTTRSDRIRIVIPLDAGPRNLERSMDESLGIKNY